MLYIPIILIALGYQTSLSSALWGWPVGAVNCFFSTPEPRIG